MKSLSLFIRENQNKNIDIFKHIDPNDFNWSRYMSNDDYIYQCKDIVKKFADELFKTTPPMDRIETLWKNSYKEYCKTNKWSNDEIEEQYNYCLKIIKKYGWGMFESQSLEQGWWPFMRWVAEKS